MIHSIILDREMSQMKIPLNVFSKPHKPPAITIRLHQMILKKSGRTPVLGRSKVTKMMEK